MENRSEYSHIERLFSDICALKCIWNLKLEMVCSAAAAAMTIGVCGNMPVKLVISIHVLTKYSWILLSFHFLKYFCLCLMKVAWDLCCEMFCAEGLEIFVPFTTWNWKKLEHKSRTKLCQYLEEGTALDCSHSFYQCLTQMIHNDF